jgi:hypothetical protein
MNNPIEGENKIDKLVSFYQDTKQLIYEVSDKQQNIISDLQNSIIKLTGLSFDVNEDLEKSFSYLSEDQAKNIIVKLSAGLKSARQLLALLSDIPPTITDRIKLFIKEFYLETKQINEFLQDLIKYKIHNPQEFKDLLNEVK